MAITKQRKDELVSHYVDWIHRSKAMIVTEYSGLTMKQFDDLRAKIRETGGEFHVMKNTLARVAFKEAGVQLDEKLFEGSTAVGFAFQDAAALAKIFNDFGRTAEVIKIKGGYLGARSINPENVKALADLPPLPVMRAQLMGTILAPASQLVRTLAEPARSLAAVLKAYADKDSAQVSA